MAQEVLVLNFSQNIFFNYILEKKNPCATCYAQKYRFLYGRNCSSTVGQPKSCRAIVLQQVALLLKEFVKTNCFIKQIIIFNLSFFGTCVSSFWHIWSKKYVQFKYMLVLDPCYFRGIQFKQEDAFHDGCSQCICLADGFHCYRCVRYIALSSF